MTDEDFTGHLAADAGLSDEEFTDETGLDGRTGSPTDTAVRSFGPD